MLSRRNVEVCQDCKYTPNYHSFHLLTENDEELYYYSCPAETKYYNDPDGLYNHIQLILTTISKPWIWVFNAAAYNIKHATCFTLNSRLLQLVSEYSGLKLKKIIIINQSFTMKMLVNFSWCYIPQRIKDKVVFDYRKHFAKLLLIDQKLAILHERLTY